MMLEIVDRGIWKKAHDVEAEGGSDDDLLRLEAY